MLLDANLRLVCGPHAKAYDDNVWRWVPGAKFREQMPSAVSLRHVSASESSEDEDGDVTMSDITVEEVRRDSPLRAHPVLIFSYFTLYPQLTKELAESSCKVAPESVEGLGVPAETLVDDGISGNTKNPEIHFKPVRYLLGRFMFSLLTAC